MLEKSTRYKHIAVRQAFIGGSFGLHDFYLGRKGRGIAKTISLGFLGMGSLQGFIGSITPILPFIVIISNVVEGFKLMSMSQHDFDLKFNPHLFVKLGDNIPTENVAVADEILKLNGLFEQGLITFEEFEKRKKKLLG